VDQAHIFRYYKQFGWIRKRTVVKEVNWPRISSLQRCNLKSHQFLWIDIYVHHADGSFERHEAGQYMLLYASSGEWILIFFSFCAFGRITSNVLVLVSTNSVLFECLVTEPTNNAVAICVINVDQRVSHQSTELSPLAPNGLDSKTFALDQVFHRFFYRLGIEFYGLELKVFKPQFNSSISSFEGTLGFFLKDFAAVRHPFAQ